MSEFDCCMQIDADCDDVNQHNKIDIELNEYNQYIFANSNASS
jgi:hypothetical protein